MRIGIDLGGTKISGIAMNSVGDILAYERVSTPPGDYQGTLDAICGLVSTLERQTSDATSIGIGTPGAISPASGLLRNSNSVCMNHMPVKQDLETMLGRSIRMANDADCFTLSEALDGAAEGAASVFGVIIGTGAGGGLVINGSLVQGVNAIAGEWGHNPLPWMTPDEYPGNQCFCGKLGCLETFISGSGLQQHYFEDTGHRATAKEIVASMDSNPDARRHVEIYVDRLARALSYVINVVDPEVVVLGGGMSNVDLLYEEVPQRWGKYIFSDVVNTRLVKNRYGDDSGVRGAARL